MRDGNKKNFLGLKDVEENLAMRKCCKGATGKEMKRTFPLRRREVGSARKRVRTINALIGNLPRFWLRSCRIIQGAVAEEILHQNQSFS